jgi:hypothetical protein
MEIVGGEMQFFERFGLKAAQLDMDLVNGMSGFAEARDEFVSRAPASSRFGSDYSGLLSDRIFENAVTTKTTMALMGAELTREARARIDSVVAMLDREIN